jgi:hypothetical protein
MCHFALVGARTDEAALRRILGGKDCELDTNIPPDPRALGLFPVTDTVVCVTMNGCSCALLAGVGLSRSSNPTVHFAGPGYAFRRALAAATLRFGRVTLLAFNSSRVVPPGEPPRQRTTTLAHFLRSGLEPGDRMVCINA